MYKLVRNKNTDTAAAAAAATTTTTLVSSSSLLLTLVRSCSHISNANLEPSPNHVSDM